MSGDDVLRARLTRIFLDELEEHVERLEHGLGDLATSLPLVPTETVGELFRSAHSLKGAAAAVGASGVSAVCHHLEDALVRIRDGEVEVDQDVVERMVRLVDGLAEAGTSLRRGMDPDQAVAVEEPAPATPESGERRPPRRAGHVVEEGGTLRVARSHLDAVLAQAGDVIAASHRSEQLMAELHAALAGRGDRVDADLQRLISPSVAHQRALRGVAAGFADSVRRVRTVPFTEATSGLARMVRDLSGDLGKQTQLSVDAARVEVDKDLASMLHDVLGHAIRNAVAHGIEPPEKRVAAGKPATGSVTVRAALHNDGIVITVTDDGRGIDPRRVREAAAILGLAPGGSEADVTELLFHPGLSTADEVSDVSGRGVGLDAVRDAVESIGGSVSLESDPGAGTRLMLRVPLVLSTLRVLLVRLGEEVVAVPTSPLRRLVRIPEQRTRLDGRETVDVGGAVVPVTALSDALGWEDVDPSDGSPEPPALVVDAVDGGLVALTVDELLSEREVVLRAAPSRLAGMNLLLGTAQLDDGSSALVLSPSACARVARAVRPVRPAQPEVAVAAAPRVLLVEDTITTRELERSILVGAGYDVVVAEDGRKAWEMLQAREFDVVVSDVNMPRMDGIVLCRSIRASRGHANLPVVLVTSLHSDADRRRGLDAGADAYITKSGFDRAELLATLERVL